MTHFRKLPCKLLGGLKCQESSGVQETNVLLRSRTGVVEVWHNCLNCSYSHSRSRTICQRNASVKKLRKRSKFQMKNASLVNPRAGSLRKRKKAQRPTRRCVQFLGSLDGHRLSTAHSSRVQTNLITSFHRSLTGSLDHFSSLSPSLPFPSLLLSSPLLSLFVTALLTLAACFFFVSTISSDSLSTWIFGGLGEGVRESNDDWNGGVITAICAPDTAAGTTVDMDSNIEEMMATCLGELRRLHRGQKEIQTTCVKLIGGLHEEVLRVVRELRALNENAPTFVSTGRTRLDVERPANPRSLQPFHAPGTSRLSTNTPKINQGLPQSSGKVESALAQPDAESRSGVHSRPVRFLLHFRLAGRETWTCGESSKRHMRTILPGMKMSPQGTLKELEKAQPSITGKYVMAHCPGHVQNPHPHRRVGDAGLRSRLGRGLARIRGGLAVVLRDLLEWRPTVSITTGFHKNGIVRTTAQR